MSWELCAADCRIRITRFSATILAVTQLSVKNSTGTDLNDSKARTLARHNQALQAEFHNAIFSPESRVAWLIRDEGTVAAVLGNH